MPCAPTANACTPQSLCRCCNTHYGVRTTVNLYAAEIRGDMTPTELCDPCADEIALDI